MCAKTTKYVLKLYQKALQIDSKYFINVLKIKYMTNIPKTPTFEQLGKDNYERISGIEMRPC